MGAIVAGDLTLTVNNRDRVRVNQKSMVMAHVAFTTSTQTYPATGVPLPAVGAFGMKKAIDFVNVMSNPGDGYVVKYDKVNHSLRIYQGSAASTHTHTLTPTGTVAAPVFTGSALAGHTHTESGTTTSSDSAGTPAGTNSAPAFTGAQGTTSASGAISAAGLSELGSVTVPTISVDLQVWGE